MYCINYFTTIFLPYLIFGIPGLGRSLTHEANMLGICIQLRFKLKNAYHPKVQSVIIVPLTLITELLYLDDDKIYFCDNIW